MSEFKITFKCNSNRQKIVKYDIPLREMGLIPFESHERIDMYVACVEFETKSSTYFIIPQEDSWGLEYQEYEDSSYPDTKFIRKTIATIFFQSKAKQNQDKWMKNLIDAGYFDWKDVSQCILCKQIFKNGTSHEHHKNPETGSIFFFYARAHQKIKELEGMETYSGASCISADEPSYEEQEGIELHVIASNKRKFDDNIAPPTFVSWKRKYSTYRKREYST